MSLRTKYKPKSIAEIIYPNSATQRRINVYASGSRSGNIVFYGSNGTGKSSVADLLPYAISGKDAFVETKSFEELMKEEPIKDYIKRSVSIARLSQSKYFLVMHEMDNAKGRIDKLWTALDDVGDEAMLIVTTNQPSKLHKSLLSRCKLIEFPAVSPAAFLPVAQQVLKGEGVLLSDIEVLKSLNVYKHLGDMRHYFEELEDLVLLSNDAKQTSKPKKPPLRVV